MINHLNTEFILIYINSVRTSQETLRLRYKVQPVNAVQGNNSCLLSETYETHYGQRTQLVC
jgi:hypothetical protein